MIFGYVICLIILLQERMRSLIKNVWKRAGIIEAIEKGLSELPSVDPFQSIDPLVHQVDFF